MYSDENKSSDLARFLNTFDYAIIDTCSLMDGGFPEWMDVVRGSKEYWKKGFEILVPRRCYDELKKHAHQHENDSKRIDAKRGLKIVKHAKWKKLLTITKKDKNENFADNAIYVRVCSDRLFSKILIITQDKSLASDLLALNHLQSQSGRPLQVCRFIAGGQLQPNRGETPSTTKERKTPASSTDAAKKPTTKTTAVSGAETVLANDARLSAVISNPNYPEEKKKEDALAQIKAIEALPESTRAQLSLLVPLPRLKEFVKAGPKPTEAKKETKASPKKAEPKPEPAPAPKAEETSQLKEKLWYGVGPNLEDALHDCARHYGIIIRDPSIAYDEKAHGPIDWTTSDLGEIIELGHNATKEDEKVTFVYKGVNLAILFANNKFKFWVDVLNLPKPEPKPKAKRVSKAKAAVEEEPKPEPAPKKAAPKKEAEPKPEAPKKTAKPKKAAAEEPKEEPKPEEAKKPAKTKKAAQKPAETEENPVEKPAKKAAKPKKAAAEESKEEAKPEPKPKKASKSEEKPAPEAASEPSEALQKAKTAERRLRANINNPNYALENKVADVKAQLALLKKLSAEERKTLKFSEAELKEWLKTNEAK